MLFCMLLTLLTQRSFWLIQIVLQNRSVNSAQCNSTQYIQCDAVQCNTTNKINHCHLGTLSEPDVKNPTFYERRTRSHFPAVCHKYSQIIQNERSGICKKKGRMMIANSTTGETELPRGSSYPIFEHRQHSVSSHPNKLSTPGNPTNAGGTTHLSALTTTGP